MDKIVVDAVDYGDIKIFTASLLKTLAKGKNFLFRTAAAFQKIIGNVTDKKLLTREEIVSADNTNGGLIIVGSHVNKTNLQLDELKKIPAIKFIEFDVLNFPSIEKLAAQIDREISAGITVTIYTSRKVFETESKEKNLMMSVKISDALTNIVRKIQVRPKFLIAKGGITSADVRTKGLGVKKALAAGQIFSGVPVWKVGAESKFPGMSFIIFPGNVGETDTLYKMVKNLEG